MKKIFFYMICCAIFISGSLVINLNAQTIDPADGGGTSCKWKQIACAGWGNGQYEACLTNGDGNSCSCGSVTRDCP